MVGFNQTSRRTLMKRFSTFLLVARSAEGLAIIGALFMLNTVMMTADAENATNMTILVGNGYLLLGRMFY